MAGWPARGCDRVGELAAAAATLARPPHSLLRLPAFRPRVPTRTTRPAPDFRRSPRSKTEYTRGRASGPDRWPGRRRPVGPSRQPRASYADRLVPTVLTARPTIWAISVAGRPSAATSTICARACPTLTRVATAQDVTARRVRQLTPPPLWPDGHGLQSRRPQPSAASGNLRPVRQRHLRDRAFGPSVLGVRDPRALPAGGPMRNGGGAGLIRVRQVPATAARESNL